MSYKTTEIVPETVWEHSNSYDIFWEIHDNLRELPVVEVSTGAIAYKRGTLDTIFIRQEGDDSVDVIEFTLAQAYDLLTVLSRALEVPST